MSDNENVVNQELVQPDQFSDSAPEAQVQDTQPPPAVDPSAAFEARLAAEAEKRRLLEDELRQMRSVVLERAMQPAPAPQAAPAPADHWAAMETQYDPNTVRAIKAAVQGDLAQQAAEMQRLRAEMARTSLLSQAQAHGPEVAALAQAAYDSEVRRGVIPDANVVTSWAVGQAVLSGKYKPASAPAPAPAARPQAAYAPQVPVVNGAPMPPKRTGLPANFEQLSRSEQIQAVESQADTDFSLF
jgi:hypothetical protein